MSTANTALRITELDFISIKENIKDYLRSQTEFQDFDFEGSGLSVLLDVLAYNTHYMGYYVNMVGNEMFLDTAQIRQSVISHAKMLNYVPKSPNSAEVKVNILVTPDEEEPDDTILTLDKYTRFLGRDIDGVNYQFVTTDSYTVGISDGAFAYSNVTLKQGEVVTRQFVMTPTNTKRRFEIPSSNVDTKTLVITVQESSTNTLTTVYKSYDSILDLTGNTAAYFVEENENGFYTVYFGDDVLGRKPKVGNIITITYLESSGSLANKINNFSIAQAAGGLFNNNVSVIPISASYSGSDRETLNDIRFKAPYFYTTQNRAVTKSDYETLITKDYTNIDAVKVWGGEDNDPPIYGKVFLSLKTKENYFLTNQEKENIKTSLIENRNVLTVIPEIVDPDYTYLIVRGTVYYNPTLTEKTADQLRSYVRAAIIDYRNDELTGFDSIFRKTTLQKYIGESEKSITGSDVSIYLQKRILITPSQTRTYVLNNNIEIKKGDYAQKISSFPKITVLDASNVERQVNIEEVPSAFTGVDSVQIINPGINYSSKPTVVISGDGTGATGEAVVSGGRIQEIIITNKGSNYSRATISIIGEGSEARAEAILEAKFGKLRTFYYLDSGEKIIVNNDIGNVNYQTGKIELNSLFTLGTVANDLYEENILTLEIPISREVIYPLRNRIIDIDESDLSAIQMSVVAE